MRNSIEKKWCYLIILCIGSSFIQCKPPVDDKETEKIQNGTDMVKIKKDTSVIILTDEVSSHHPLELTINNLKSTTAPVVVIVFNSKHKFLKPNGRHKRYKFIPTSESLTVQIKDLEYGTFAMAIFQDMNDNGKLDKNALGLPKEGYAFSNNHKPKIKAPNFHQCKFNYNAKTPALKIKLLK